LFGNIAERNLCPGWISRTRSNSVSTSPPIILIFQINRLSPSLCVVDRVNENSGPFGTRPLWLLRLLGRGHGPQIWGRQSHSCFFFSSAILTFEISEQVPNTFISLNSPMQVISKHGG
jgi:hypothetical protein